ncbi:uncharacterized acetyltransferase at3g50280 [Phtheirospermum japonicum]|uniref:Uncharacterized acetyltransferase at3g50280 n=1 Tax=Phtheirospermum japonicum TaxID=374723 RepID=A0A830BMX3_9LAMI|nr:uncharacterized acetyltransferase at3g50280 [Phtheirospermum japonicum]
MAKLKVISSSLVPIATITKSMPRMDLTPWDLQLLLLGPIQKGILFHKPELENTTNIIDHLKNSFSRTLDFFPPLAGRIGTVSNNNDDKTTFYFVDCNNAGAEFTHASASTVSVSDISEAKYIPEIVSSLFPLNGVLNFEGVSKPLLGVQITELADGFFMGFTANHAVIDGTSLWHFINSWSEISRGFGKVSKNPVFERDLVPNGNRATPIPTIDKNLLPKLVGPPLLERFYHFSKENLAKLKAKANSEASSDKISTLQALLAHLWRSLTRCRQFFVSSFGISETELLQDGLGQTGLKINAFITQHTSKEAIFGFVEDWVKNPTPLRLGTSNFIISSSPRYDVYGNDFGWGKPIAVRSGRGQKRDGKMTLFPAAEPGGIDVEACLAPETMRALDDDVEFMETIAP